MEMACEMERPRVNNIEFTWALQQLSAMGFIEQRGEDIRITDAGISRALVVESSLDVQDKVLLMMMYRLIEAKLDES